MITAEECPFLADVFDYPIERTWLPLDNGSPICFGSSMLASFFLHGVPRDRAAVHWGDFFLHLIKRSETGIRLQQEMGRWQEKTPPPTNPAKVGRGSGKGQMLEPMVGW